MRRSDDVFFFTLIDFLLQVFFFGLLLFVVGQSLKSEEELTAKAREELLDRALKANGVSNITELSDLLTRLAPLDRLRGTADFIERNGGPEVVEKGLKAVEAAGGPEKAAALQEENAALSERLAKLEGWGKVSCLPSVMVNGRLQPKTIATAVVSDDSISIQDPMDEFLALLKAHGLEFDSVRRQSLAAFTNIFTRVVTREPNCRYFLSIQRETKFFEPMRVFWSIFRTP